MQKSGKSPFNRRNFLKGAAAGAAGFVAKPAAIAAAQEPRPVQVSARTVEVGGGEGKHASDFMVDIFKSLGIE
jgi:hypothetical protein